VNLKAYFYALRGACAISWIRRYDEVPPMTLPALLSHDVIPDDARAVISRLLAAKASMGEVGHGFRQAPLDAFIEAQMAWVKESGMDRLEDDPVFFAEANQLLLDAMGVG
jgi:predicted nucleotidyltransferase